MKLQLVTHSIIPNLNSGLVPINPVGLVGVLNSVGLGSSWTKGSGPGLDNWDLFGAGLGWFLTRACQL